MVFTIVQWFVLIFSLIAIIKILFIIFNPKAWLGFAKHLYGKGGHVLMVVELILALGLFYYLLKEISLIQIMASIVLGALLTGITFASFGQETIKFGSKMFKKKHSLGGLWVTIIIWLLLSVWAIVSLF